MKDQTPDGLNDARWVEELLACEANHIDDAGFSDRVTRGLPEKRPRRSRRREAVLLVSAAAAGAVGFVGVSGFPSMLTEAVSPVHAVAGGLVVALSLWAALVAAASEV